MKPVLDTRKPAQIAVIVRDVETVKRKYAAFWGMEVPPTVDAGAYEVTKTEYMGKPAPDAGCMMAFFDLESIQFEIIQPNEARSTWRDFLEEKGEGLHHIAFNVEDIHLGIKACENFGMKLTQWGYYGDASGAYAYMDATTMLGCFIELLCSFKK
jgi:methylmalonyl-CoA/ethylmalonyl-CoA epimerase